jgi:Putative Flp pilus-assembly TadE/G-like
MKSRQPGQILPLMSIMIVVLLVVTGLALDGGQALVARREAQGVADAAARAGADQLDEASVRAGDNPPNLNTDAAYAAAANYVGIQRPGMFATIVVAPQRVDVHVSLKLELTFMRLTGLSSATIDADGSAEPRTGITVIGN